MTTGVHTNESNNKFTFFKTPLIHRKDKGDKKEKKGKKRKKKIIMNRTHKYVKVYVSEKGTLIYIFNSPNRDGIFFEREAERRVIQLDIASRAERWKRVVIEYPRVCEKTMGA